MKSLVACLSPACLFATRFFVTCFFFTCLTTSFAHAGPSNLWTDNHGHHSITIPLDTPSQGIARARILMQDNEHLRAARALHKVVTRWPNATQAHELLVESLNKLGETTLAAHHARQAQLARGGVASSDPISTIN